MPRVTTIARASLLTRHETCEMKCVTISAALRRIGVFCPSTNARMRFSAFFSSNFSSASTVFTTR